MKSFRELLDQYFREHPEEHKHDEEAIDQWLADNADELIKMFSASLARDLDAKQREHVDLLHSDMSGFQGRLLETWRAPLVRLDSLIGMCREIGSEISVEYRSSGKYPRSSRRSMTTRLHARAVQIAHEVACLSKGGFADGAMARWRSLHETTVILAFLGRHDDELASRFVDFQEILRWKAACEYNEHHAALGFDPIPPSDMSRYERKRDLMVAKYGDSFKNETGNGWASEVIRQKRVTFRDIENYVHLNHLRPQYGFASKNIHSGVDSIGYKLGLSMSNQETLLYGPSNMGLIEPIQCTSYSLIIATGELIGTAPHDERAIMEGVLWCWHEKLKEELVAADAALRLKGKAANDTAGDH